MGISARLIPTRKKWHTSAVTNLNSSSFYHINDSRLFIFFYSYMKPIHVLFDFLCCRFTSWKWWKVKVTCYYGINLFACHGLLFKLIWEENWLVEIIFFVCLMSCDREFCGNDKVFGEVMCIKGFIGNLGEDLVQNGP